MYDPICAKNQLIIGRGIPVIVSGWLNPQKLIEYQPLTAVIGSLYSARGIAPLARNLLANPEYRDVIFLITTRFDANAKIESAILEWLEQGLHRPPDIPQMVWRGLTAQIRPVIVHDIRNLKTILEQPFKRDIGGIRLTYPEPPIDGIQYAGRQYGVTIQAPTIAECWLKMVAAIRRNGVVHPNGFDTYWQELIDLVAIVTDEPDTPHTTPYTPSLADIQQYIPQILADNTDTSVKYTYGQRLRSWFGRDQILDCVEKLRREPTAASAVMSLWDVSDHTRGGSPCLNHIWLRLRGGQLHLSAIFRSNDIFSAWFLNAQGLRALQRYIRDLVDPKLELAPLITISQSAHIYSDCWEFADNLPLIPNLFNDLAGYFLICWVDDCIVVTQVNDRFEERVFRGLKARAVCQDIANANPNLDTSHALYLGREIQLCEGLKGCYVQS